MNRNVSIVLLVTGIAGLALGLQGLGQLEVAGCRAIFQGQGRAQQLSRLVVSPQVVEDLAQGVVRPHVLRIQ